MINVEQQIPGDGQEIGLNEVIDFIVIRWKVLLIGASLGLIMALGGASLLVKYEAVATLVNKSSVDYLAWKSLKRNLPMLAARISEENNNGGDFVGVLSSEAWWQKNVVPTFALAKEDTKAVPKELQDAESIKIKDFVVTATGKSKEEALKNLSVATSFFRSGAAYLALKDVIANYQMELLNSESENAKNIAALQIELAYLNDRMAGLELLKAKFPGNSASIITQSMDPKDSSAKYLPIITQLIAVNNDISALKENLSRLNSSKSQLAIKNDFLSQAMPVIDKNFDGLSAVTELMRIESGMRKNLQPSDWNKVSILNNIKHDLALIHARFTLGLEQPTYISTSKPHFLKPAAIGLAAGFFLSLLFSLCFAIWLRYRQQKL